MVSKPSESSGGAPERSGLIASVFLNAPRAPRDICANKKTIILLTPPELRVGVQMILLCYLAIADFHSNPGYFVSSIEASFVKVVMLWRLPVARYAVSLWQLLLIR